MKRIFGRIRLSLFNQSKIGKYLGYAFGEIILVVIGILIALQINNWNENRKSKQELDRIYLSIIDEIDNDVQILNEYLPIFEWKVNTLTRILNGAYSAEDWINNDSLYRSFSSYPDFAISQEKSNLLKTKVALDQESRDLNNLIADFHNKYTVDIDIKSREAFTSFHRNYAYWEEHEAWFFQAFWQEKFDKLSLYATRSPIFKNKIAFINALLRRLFLALDSYRKDAIILQKEIESYLIIHRDMAPSSK